MFLPKKFIETTANGRLKVRWPDASRSFYTWLCLWLKLRYGLRRSSRNTMYAPDDSIMMPDFVGDGFRLLSGWNTKDGYCLQAKDPAGDLFLKRVFAKQ